MRVWVIGRGYPTSKNNMYGSFELEQAKMLRKYGFDVSYLLVDIRSIRHFRKFGYYCITENGIKIEIASFPIAGLILHKQIKKHSLIVLEKLILRLIKKEGIPDIIHIHYPSYLEYKTVSKAQRKGAKIVITEHWSEVQRKTLDRYHLSNLKDFVEHADAICCVGSTLKKSIIELTGTKKNIFIVPNVISEEFKLVDNPHKDFRFIASGRFVPIKQYDKIVNAFIDVFQNDKRVSLTLAGNGKEYGKIASIIMKRDAIDQVHLLGTVSRIDMATIMSKADVLVVYSKMETFCVPVVEAWMSGKPVIATNTTSVFSDNQDDRLGTIVDCNDIESLKKGFIYIYQHYSQYDSKWISNYAKTNFGEEAVFKIISDVYSSV